MATTAVLGAGRCGGRRSAAAAAAAAMLRRAIQTRAGRRPPPSSQPSKMGGLRRCCGRGGGGGADGPIVTRPFATSAERDRPPRHRRPLSSMANAFHDDDYDDDEGEVHRHIVVLDEPPPDGGSSSSTPLPGGIAADADPRGGDSESGLREAHCDTCTCHRHDGRAAADADAHPGAAVAVAVAAPAPAPKWSFHKRVLPPNLTALSSPEGKRLFAESLSSGDADSYFPLSEQFLTQSDPAYCGLSTLVMVLNALSVDPNVRWRGGWRWFEEGMLLGGCCVDMEDVKRDGISMDQFAGIGRCNGAAIRVRRPGEPRRDVGFGRRRGMPAEPDEERVWDEDDLRSDIRRHVRNPPPPAGDGAGFLVASFARSSLRQTGEGHFSPVAAYHAPTDRALVLDVARFKYAPYWVSVSDLYEAMLPPDGVTGRPRGWFEVRPSSPPVLDDEKKRPGDLVADGFAPDGGGQSGGRHACPVGDIKVTFCAASPAATAAGPSKGGSSSAGTEAKGTPSTPPPPSPSSPMS